MTGYRGRPGSFFCLRCDQAFYAGAYDDSGFCPACRDIVRREYIAAMEKFEKKLESYAKFEIWLKENGYAE